MQIIPSKNPLALFIRWEASVSAHGFGCGSAALRLCDKFGEPRLGGAGKFHGPAAPGETHGAGVERLVRQNEPGALLIGQAIFDQRQIQILVAAIEFIADDGMAEVGEVDADLVLAPGAGNEAKKGKRGWSRFRCASPRQGMEDGRWSHLTPALSPASGGEGEFSSVTPLSFVLPIFAITQHNISGKAALDPIFGLGGRAIGPHAIFHCDDAALVLAERRVNQAVVVADAAVDDGQIFFLDGAGFPDFSQLAGDFGIFGDDDDAAGFAVETVDEMGVGSWVWDFGSWILRSRSRGGSRFAKAMQDRGRLAERLKDGNHLTPALSPASGGEGEIQIEAEAADEAGKLIALGRMTDEAGRFVDDQQAGVFVEDGK
jgi:hypothetical protein